MSWARFDDHFDDDPDCDIAGEIGICLFLCSITWASRNLTDGFIPAARVKKLPGGADKAALAALLSVAWWVQVDGGYQIRNFLRYNLSRAEREYQASLAGLRETWDKERSRVAPLIYERDGRFCQYCGASDDMTIDHILPLSRGGDNTLDNLTPACRSCNSRKNNRVEGWQR